MSRPVDDPAWATATNYAAGPHSGNANKARPAAGIISEGFDPGSGLPTEWLNYLLANHGDWLRWLLTLPTTASDAAQYQYQNSAGNTRSFTDHNGYTGFGRLSVIEEIWNCTFSLSASTTPITTNPRWSVFTSTGTTFNTAAPNAGYPNPTVAVVTTATLNSRGTLYSAIQLIDPTATMLSAVYEFDISIATSAGESYAGLSSATDMTTGGAHFIRFRQTQGVANWQAETRDGSTTTTVDSGVAVATGGTIVRMKIELHGSASPYGQKARFFINGTKVAESTTHLPSSALYLAFEANNTNSAAQTLNVGALRGVWNRFLSPEAV